MLMTLSINVVKFTNLVTSNQTYGYTAMDDESSEYFEDYWPSLEAFQQEVPSEQALIDRVLGVDAFEHIDPQEDTILVDAPAWP